MKPRRAALRALSAIALAVFAGTAPYAQRATLLDIDGRPRDPFKPADAANVIVFVATDCPISNAYAPEIQRICNDYRTRGVSCVLAYEDLDSGSGTDLGKTVREHLREYRYADIPAIVDRSRVIARQAKASITPQAVIVDRDGNVRYRGRIDNWYAALGKRRQMATEHDLREAIDAVLDGRLVRNPETEALGCYIADPRSLRK